MRHVAWSLGLALVLAAVGCSNTRFGFVKNNPPPLAVEKPTVEGLVEYLNRNARQIQSLECNHVDISCRQGLQSFGVDAKLACQKPRNFRLGAFAGLGTQQVDIGSNNQEFWYWIAKADPPYIYRCTYQDFERGVALPFPFQPEWIMEALGMGEYGPPENYRLVEQKNSWELVQQVRNSQGQVVRKVTEFSKTANRVQVRGHRLLDAQNKEIYSAQVNDVHVVGGIVVPRQVTFNWPEQKLSMTLRLGRSADQVTLNQQYPPNRVAELFTRPVMRDVPTVDLAEVQRRAGGIQPAGGPVR